MQSISSDYATLLTRGAVSQGHALDSLLQRAGISPAVVAAPRARLTFQQISMLYKVTWIATGDENLGLSDRPCKLGNFRFLADILSRYQRLETVLRYAGTFYEVTRDDISFYLEREQGLARVVIQVEGSADPDHILKEYYLMAWQRYISWLVGIEIDWLETTFSFARPERADLYASLFSGKLEFSRERCSFSFNSRYLKRRVNRSRVDILHYVKTLPRPLFTPVGRSTHYSQLIRDLLRQGHSAELPGFREVAQALSINARTMHRKLAQEGTSFQAIKSQYRCDLAVECLIEKNMSIQEISDHTGFREPSSFCRFFKAATGLSPSRYTEVFSSY